jgi:hypothetical protein
LRGKRKTGNWLKNSSVGNNENTDRTNYLPNKKKRNTKTIRTLFKDTWEALLDKASAAIYDLRNYLQN